MPEAPLLNVVDLVKQFPLGGGILAKPRAWIKAVDGVSFAVAWGESFGLVGESGSGKNSVNPHGWIYWSEGTRNQCVCPDLAKHLNAYSREPGSLKYD